jgi:predicted MFS family arabinose efflux permease
MAFNQPARQSFIPNLVPREILANAVALNSVAFNMTRILGPSVAGLLIVPLGIGGVFMLKGFLMFAVVAFTMMIATRFEHDTSHQETSLLGSLGEGVKYAIKDRFILAIVALTMGLFVFGMPYQQVFVPLIAKDVLDIGPAGLGLMLAIMGAGALVGALAIATVGSFRQRGLFLIGGASAFGLSLVAFAVSASIPFLIVPFLAVAVSGMLRMTYMSTSNAFLLEMSPPHMHGRVMSFLSLDRGLVSLGAILAGVLAAVAGPQWGLIIMGTLCMVMPLLVAAVFPQLRRVD